MNNKNRLYEMLTICGAFTPVAALCMLMNGSNWIGPQEHQIHLMLLGIYAFDLTTAIFIPYGKERLVLLFSGLSVTLEALLYRCASQLAETPDAALLSGIREDVGPLWVSLMVFALIWLIAIGIKQACWSFEELQEKQAEFREQRRRALARAGKAVLQFVVPGMIVAAIFLAFLTVPNTQHITKWLGSVTHFQTDIGNMLEPAETDKENEGNSLEKTDAAEQTMAVLHEGSPAKEEGGDPQSGAKPADPPKGMISELAFYTVFFISVFAALYLGAVLLLRMVRKVIRDMQQSLHPGLQQNEKGFFDEYGTALSVFIVALSILLVAAEVGTGSEDVGRLAEKMVWVLVVIIGLLIGVDVVRLTLEQCIEKGSFLRSAMHLVFVLIVENAMGVLLTALMSLRIKSMVESVFFLLFPGAKTFVHRRVDQVLEDALNREIDWVESLSICKDTDRRKKCRVRKKFNPSYGFQIKRRGL